MQIANFLKIGSLNYFSRQHGSFLSIFTDKKWIQDIQIISLPKERSQDCRVLVYWYDTKHFGFGVG